MKAAAHSLLQTQSTQKASRYLPVIHSALLTIACDQDSKLSIVEHMLSEHKAGIVMGWHGWNVAYRRSTLTRSS